jgi:DNA transformation protein
VASADLVDLCLELLAPLGQARARRMFGGHGLYVDGLFVALIASDRLYLKADETTRTDFADAGGEPFVYDRKGRPATLNFWTVPAEAMESPALMQPWARRAMQSALKMRLPARTAAAAGMAPKPRARRKPSAP